MNTITPSAGIQTNKSIHFVHSVIFRITLLHDLQPLLHLQTNLIVQRHLELSLRFRDSGLSLLPLHDLLQRYRRLLPSSTHHRPIAPSLFVSTQSLSRTLSQLFQHERLLATNRGIHISLALLPLSTPTGPEGVAGFNDGTSDGLGSDR